MPWSLQNCRHDPWVPWALAGLSTAWPVLGAWYKKTHGMEGSSRIGGKEVHHAQGDPPGWKDKAVGFPQQSFCCAMFTEVREP